MRKSWNIYINAGIFSFIIFIVGIAIGIQLNIQRSKLMEEELNEIKRGIESIELQFLFLDTVKKNGRCEFFTGEINRLAVEADKLAKRLVSFENSKQVDVPEYVNLKKDYTLVLVRYWLTAERIKKSCNESFITVLYFYDRDCGIRCENQGFLLSYFKAKLGDDLLVFAIDKNIDLQIVRMIKETFNVKVSPTLIVNGKTYEGFIDKDKLNELLCSRRSC